MCSRHAAYCSTNDSMCCLLTVSELCTRPRQCTVLKADQLLHCQCLVGEVQAFCLQNVTWCMSTVASTGLLTERC